MARTLRTAGYRGDESVEGHISGVSIDTRSGCAEKLFVALRGDNGDGHDFIPSAVDGGAAALLVSSDRREDACAAAGGVPVFDVTDPLEGLQTLAAAYRDDVSPKVVAVTGSTGKTETKEIAASVIASRFTVHATPGNLNNHIGLPLTLLGMNGSAEVLVAEMGANHKNEIKRLAGIARPETGVITNIGPGHLEHFGSLKGVAAAKSELVQALPSEGTAVLPADDDFLDYLKGRTEASVVTFGFAETADFRIHDVEERGGGGYRFHVGEIEAEMKLYGRHHLLNAAAAIAVGCVLGVPAEGISGAVAGYRAVDGRGVLYRVDGVTFVDDSYNANPASLTAAVDAFMEMPVTGRRFLVLGDMLELGERSAELHREVGIYCGRAGVDGIFTLGDETVELNRAAAEQRKAPPDISHFLDIETLAGHLNGLLRGEDAVLVKGSRGMKMERVIGAIERLRDTTRRKVD